MNLTREETWFALVLEEAADKRPAFLEAMREGDPALRQHAYRTAFPSLPPER